MTIRMTLASLVLIIRGASADPTNTPPIRGYPVWCDTNGVVVAPAAFSNRVAAVETGKVSQVDFDTHEADTSTAHGMDTNVWDSGQYPEAVLLDGSRTNTGPVRLGFETPGATNDVLVVTDQGLVFRIETFDGDYIVTLPFSSSLLSIVGNLSVDGQISGNGTGLTNLNANVIGPLTSPADDPTDRTPRWRGDSLIIYGTTNIHYIAFGLTTNDWVKVWPAE